MPDPIQPSSPRPSPSLSPKHDALIAAARHHPGHRLVPPERVRGRARRLLADKLVALGLAEPVAGAEEAWWTDPQAGPTGLRLTRLGATEGDDEPTAVIAERSAAPREPRPASKLAHVLARLRCAESSDLAGLVALTGWQPHTARAALTGLRRRGYAIAARREAGRNVYRLAAADAPALAEPR